MQYLKKFARLLFLFLAIAGFGVVYFYLQSTKSVKPVDNPDFVTLDEGKFKCMGRDFFPVILNYIVSVQIDSNTIWPTPYFGYSEHSKFTAFNRIDALAQIRTDLEQIRNLGFNTIRVVGLCEFKVKEQATGLLKLDVYRGNEQQVEYFLTEKWNLRQYFIAIENFLGIASELNLKVILVAPMIAEVPSTSLLLKQLVTHFNRNTQIMAWDLLDRPMYSDPVEHRKQEVFEITGRWKKIIDQWAPNHLFTVSLNSPPEVLEWDHKMIQVDFISIHLRDSDTSKVFNCIRWYSKTATKPWIVAGASFPGGPDSLSLSKQEEMLKKSFVASRAFKASGFGYWQYKDLTLFDYSENSAGLISNSGIKPAAKAISKITIAGNELYDIPGEFTPTSGDQFVLTGLLVDGNGKPLQNGVVVVWDEFWGPYVYGFTGSNGRFEISTDFQIFHWKASASGYSMVQGDIEKDPSVSANQVLYKDVGKIVVEDLKLTE